MEKGWQGNPAQRRSKAGISSGSAFRMSLQNHSPFVSTARDSFFREFIDFTMAHAGKASRAGSILPGTLRSRKKGQDNGCCPFSRSLLYSSFSIECGHPSLLRIYGYMEKAPRNRMDSTGLGWLPLFECCLRFLRRFGSFATGLTIARNAFLRFCGYRAAPGGFPVTRGDTGGQTGLLGFRFISRRCPQKILPPAPARQFELLRVLLPLSPASAQSARSQIPVASACGGAAVHTAPDTF